MPGILLYPDELPPDPHVRIDDAAVLLEGGLGQAVTIPDDDVSSGDGFRRSLRK